MGGAPPLPHDFAPQGGKNVPFLAPEDQGPEGAPGTPRSGRRGGPGGPRGGLGGPPSRGLPRGGLPGPGSRAPRRRRRRDRATGTLPSPWGVAEERPPCDDPVGIPISTQLGEWLHGYAPSPNSRGDRRGGTNGYQSRPLSVDVWRRSRCGQRTRHHSRARTGLDIRRMWTGAPRSVAKGGRENIRRGYPAGGWQIWDPPGGSPGGPRDGAPGGAPGGGPGTGPPGGAPRGAPGGVHFGGYLITLPVGTKWNSGFSGFLAPRGPSPPGFPGVSRGPPGTPLRDPPRPPFSRCI